MKIKRYHLLLCSACCLLASPSVLSQNSAHVDLSQHAATPHTAEIIPQNKLQLASLSPAAVHGVDAAVDSVIDSTIADDQITELPDQALPVEERLAPQRELFIEAERALDRGRDARFLELAEQLEDYPLYPFLRYQWLKQNLDRDVEIRAFLEQHPGSRYAPFLKRKWLYHLARHRQWETFLQHYEAGNDTGLNCYYHRAQWNTGDKPAALDGAAKLWVAGKSQPRACDPLFSVLKKSPHFDDKLFWQRFDAAMANNNTQLARYVKQYMSKPEQHTADLWLKLHRSPERYLTQLLKKSEHPRAAAMFSHAVHRLTRKDIYDAIEAWDNHRQQFALDNMQLGQLERRLALKLAYKNDAGAYDRLGRLEAADYRSKAARIRVALYEQDWPRVSEAIEALDSADRQREKWQYWLARAWQETGRPIQAHELLSELATRRDFYGYLAADQLNREYQLVNNPLNISAHQIAAIGLHDEFRVAREFLALGRDNDAKLQWWHAVSQLDKDEIPAAAKLAQQWDWHEIPVLTIAKVKQWDDIDLRFPLGYADDIHAQAEQYGLDPVILFGLVRRESVFNKDAHSWAGARGLMQLMPGTGKQVARALKERWRGSNSLYDPQRNLRYGSYYYQKLVKQFNGNYAIALAAYNAGPHRVKQWLPHESVPADIWIETIPFRETRDYVTSVLVYAMIYQQLLQTSEQLSLQEITRQVEPLSELALN